MMLLKALHLTVLLTASLLAGTAAADSVTLEELRADIGLTPERFASHFATFEFQLREKVQTPEAFLAAKNGDCDDYATLAADVLRQRGYTPKLVVVFMPKDIHVVCYIPETKSYLDFNARNSDKPAIPSNGGLDEIADEVAKSFGSTWHCVSEFTFQNGVRKVVQVDFPRAKPSAPSVAPHATEPKLAAAAN